MTPPYQIRHATVADLPDILALERSTFDAPHWTKKDYKQFVTKGSGNRCLLLATLIGTLAGVAAASVVGETGELESVAVGAAYQRQGLGYLLCRTTLNWCSERGAGHVFLEVRSAGLGAQRLYRRLGFQPVGTRPKYYSNPDDDALVMRLNLSQFPSQGTASPEV